MIRISKEEMMYLQTKGFMFPSALHKTYSNRGNNRYYATASTKLMPILEQYRNNKIVYTKE